MQKSFTNPPIKKEINSLTSNTDTRSLGIARLCISTKLFHSLTFHRYFNPFPFQKAFSKVLLNFCQVQWLLLSPCLNLSAALDTTATPFMKYSHPCLCCWLTFLVFLLSIWLFFSLSSEHLFLCPSLKCPHLSKLCPSLPYLSTYTPPLDVLFHLYGFRS